VQYRLSWTKQAGVITADIYLVAPRDQFLADGSRNAVLNPHVATVSVRIHEPRGFERGLKIHLKIDDIGHELSVRLGLIPTAYDAEPDVQVAFFHERRNDRVEGPHPGLQSVRLGRVQRKPTGPILQVESSSLDGNPGPKGAGKALNDRGDVAVPIDYCEIHGVAQFRL
jgi:hypothetical protein